MGKDVYIKRYCLLTCKVATIATIFCSLIYLLNELTNLLKYYHQIPPNTIKDIEIYEQIFYNKTKNC